MTGNPLPDELGRFILTSIPSVPYLEAVLLLRRESSLAWSSSQLATRLYLPEVQAAELLRGLESAGIAAHCGGQDGPAYQYQPSPELARILDQVAQAYATSLRAVTDLIHSRVRRAHQFADAFRLRKDS